MFILETNRTKMSKNQCGSLKNYPNTTAWDVTFSFISTEFFEYPFIKHSLSISGIIIIVINLLINIYLIAFCV